MLYFVKYAYTQIVSSIPVSSHGGLNVVGLSKYCVTVCSLFLPLIASHNQSCCSEALFDTHVHPDTQKVPTHQLLWDQQRECSCKRCSCAVLTGLLQTLSPPL